MSEIPKDIETAADAAFFEAWDDGHSGAVARAIMAERKRCAGVARELAGDVIAFEIEAGE